MDSRSFDALARSLAGSSTRRGLLGSLAALGAGLIGARQADAQVSPASQASCGNQFCASNPGGCKPGCVCCVYTNPVTGKVFNSRCRPPGACSPGTTVCPPGQVLGPSGACATPTTTTLAPCAAAGCTQCTQCVATTDGEILCPTPTGGSLDCAPEYRCSSLAECLAINQFYTLCATTDFGLGNGACVPAGEGRCGGLDSFVCVP